jgi:hypothetical protein
MRTTETEFMVAPELTLTVEFNNLRQPIYKIKRLHCDRWDATWDIGEFTDPREAERSFKLMGKWLDMSQEQILRRYPRLCAHIIAESLGYSTPNHAATLLKRAYLRLPDWCEWIACCYKNNAAQMLANAIDRRHHHHGYMSSVKAAQEIIRRQLESGKEPLLASWM